MALTEDQVRQIVWAHDQWSAGMEGNWRKIDATYRREFWSDVDHQKELSSKATVEAGGAWTRVQIDSLRPWTTSFMASLFYKGLQSTAAATRVGAAVKAEDLEAVNLAVNEWLSEADVASVGNLGFKSSLLYDGGGAFLLWCDDCREANPLAAVQVDYLQPWEVVYDRTATSKKRLPYIGRLRYMTADEFRAEFNHELDPGFKGDKYEPAVTDPSGDVDTEAERALRLRGEWVRVLYLWDIRDKWTEEDPETGEKTEVVGSFRRFLLPVRSGGSGSVAGMVEMPREPIPYQWPDGTPLVSVYPVTIDSVPSRSLENVAPVWAVYEIAKELNVAASQLATQSGIRACEIGGYDPARLTADGKAAMKSGAPSIMLELDQQAEGNIGNIITFAERPPLPQALLDYRKLLTEQLSSATGTNALALGGQLDYASATEVDTARDYHATQIGLAKNEVDKVVAFMCNAFRCLLAASMELGDIKSIVVNTRDDKTVRLTTKKLLAGMRFTLADSSTGAQAESREQLAYNTAVKTLGDLLMLLLAAVQKGDEPAIAAFKALYDRGVKLYRMPESMLSDAILAKVSKKIAPEQQQSPAGQVVQLAAQQVG